MSSSLRLLTLEPQRPEVDETDAWPSVGVGQRGMVRLDPRWPRAPSVGGDGKTFGVPTSMTMTTGYGVKEWLRGCGELKKRRIARAKAWDREQQCVAMGYLATLILKHWRRSAFQLRVWRFVISRTGLVRGFRTWVEWLDVARGYGRLGVDVAWRLRRYFPVGRAFEKWWRITRTMARGDALRNWLRRWAAFQLSRAFQKWLSTIAALRRAARAMLRAFRTWQRRGDLGHAWWKWKRVALFRGIVDRAIRRWRHARIAKAFTKWRTHRSSLFRHIVTKILQGAQLRAMARAFRSWHLASKLRWRRQLRAGHCACVYNRGTKCRCSFDDHLTWRLRALRQNLDAALRSDAPPTVSSPALLSWNDRRAAATAANHAKADLARDRAAVTTSPRGPADEILLVQSPTVERMALNAYRGRLSTDTHNRLDREYPRRPISYW